MVSDLLMRRLIIKHIGYKRDCRHSLLPVAVVNIRHIYVRSTADFYFALEKAGFERLTLNRKRFFKGLRIREDTGAEEDFLQ
jgi:hypothetical protein